jgi:hypothetical protein
VATLHVLRVQGSVLIARPLEGGRAEVGGAVALDEVREFAV